MAYNQGGDRGGFRGGDRGGRPSFGGPKRWGGNDRGGRDDRPTEMFKAVCSECGKTCEVPFRPSGDKPVFCNECFGKKKGDTGTAPRNDRGPRMDFAPRPPAHGPAAHGPVGGDPMHKQMEAINSKLDRLIKLMEGTAVVKPAKVENVKPWEKTSAPVKVANAPELKALLDRAMDKPAKKSTAKPAAKKVAPKVVAKKSAPKTAAKKPARTSGGVVAKKKK